MFNLSRSIFTNASFFNIYMPDGTLSKGFTFDELIFLNEEAKSINRVEEEWNRVGSHVGSVNTVNEVKVE